MGDVGDNRRRRRSVVVYRLREPAPPRGPADTLRVVPLLDSIVLAYPDGAHDAEALAVTRTGDLLIITKDRSGPAILFRASATRGDAVRPLRRIGALAMRTSPLTGRLATGAALAPDDALLAVRTYVSIHLFRLAGDSVPAPLTGASGHDPSRSWKPRVRRWPSMVPTAWSSPPSAGPSDHALLTRLRLVRTGP